MPDETTANGHGLEFYLLLNVSVCMLKFLGSTIGIIFLIGLVVVIALIKFVF